MIEVENLGKRFHDKKRGIIHAVEDLHFRCLPGYVYGLLGANGAGKTTTLRILATLLKPSEGHARVAGYDIVREPEQVRRNIGFLSAAMALYGRLTAQELVEYFGRLHGLSESVLRSSVDSLFAQLGMDEFRHRRCDDLSTGMKQKVSVARTLVHDPPVVILDEPTAGLDVTAARTILDFIKQCRERGKTVLFSTHIMGEAEKLCDTIGIIHNGRLMAEGSLTQLQTRYQQQNLEEIFLNVVQS